MPTPYQIRAATPDDVAAIASLLAELSRDEGSEVHVQEAALTAALFGQVHEVKLQALVAEDAPTGDGNAIVATLLYYPGYDTLSASAGYHLADMVVTQAHRRRGIGKQLIAALATQTLAEQKTWVSLTVLTKNHAAQGLYQSLGMTQVDVNFWAIGKKALAQL